MYKILRKLLFILPPELAHKLALVNLKLLYKLGLAKLIFGKAIQRPVNCFGLTFKNNIGIAAGFDKNGDYIDCLASLGIGFIEIGGVTPQPQPGNPKPRLHRLINENALINWFGLNNKGVNHLVNNLKQCKHKCLIAVNLAKNSTTPNEQAEKDYIYCLEKIFPYVDFVVVNISCPNSSNIEQLQTEDHLSRMLAAVINQRDQLQHRYDHKVPLLVKISPDLNHDQLEYLVSVIVNAKADGIVATNTSSQRKGVEHCEQAEVKGGLSGAPLTQQSELILKQLKQLAPNLPVISSGGIMSVDNAKHRFELGAELIELYTGLIYQGPGLIRAIAKKV